MSKHLPPQSSARELKNQGTTKLGKWCYSLLTQLACGGTLSLLLTSGCKMIGVRQTAQDGTLGSWPMPRHDTSLTGHSSARGQIVTPEIMCRYPLGAAKCAQLWAEDLDGDGEQELLAAVAGDLLAVAQNGKTPWRVQTSKAPVIAVTDLDGNGTKEVVLRGPEVRSAVDGYLLWRPAEASARHEYRIHVGRFLQEFKGQQIATVTMNGFDLSAQVYTFENGATEGKVLWARQFQTSDFGDYAPGMISDIDQDGDPELCVGVQGGIVALDLRTGAEKLRFEWEVGGRKVRNYGQIAACDIDGDGRSEVVFVNTLVALQLAVIKIGDGGKVSLLWNRHWGDWYPNTPYLLHTALLSITDLDGDGRAEIAISVYEHGKGWTLQVYDSHDGTVLAERYGLYLDSVVLHGPGGQALLLCSDQHGPTLSRFSVLHGLSYERGELREQWRREDAHLEGQWFDRHEVDFGSGTAQAMDQRTAVMGDWNRDGILEFVISEDRDQDGRTDRLAAIDPSRSRDWRESVVWLVEPNDDVSVLHALEARGDDVPKLLIAGAHGHVWSLNGKGVVKGRFFAGGPFLPTPAVADLDGDGTNEIVVGSSDGNVNAVKFTGKREAPFRFLWRQPGWGTFGQLPGAEMPVLADLDGDGINEVLVGIYERGLGAGLACLNGDGTSRWKWFWPAEVPGPEHRPIRSWTVGRFGRHEAFDVFLSTRISAQGSSGSTQESWVLNGASGGLLWHSDAKGISDYWYKTLGPSDLPSVWDVNGDGVDDILMMSLAFVLLLDGSDGRPLRKPVHPMTHFGEGTPWTADGSVAVQDLNGDGEPELLLTATFGVWGAMALDGKPLWSIDPGVGSECRYHGGLSDVDGDSRVELGMPHAEGFRCYDAATGGLKWKLADLRGTTDVITADIDGDGNDEFILGSGTQLVALKGKESGGSMLWSLDLSAPIGAPIVADINGDGLVEILVGSEDGVLSVVSGR